MDELSQQSISKSERTDVSHCFVSKRILNYTSFTTEACTPKQKHNLLLGQWTTILIPMRTNTAKHFLRGMDVISNFACLQVTSLEICISLCGEQEIKTGKYIAMQCTIKKL